MLDDGSNMLALQMLGILRPSVAPLPRSPPSPSKQVRMTSSEIAIAASEQSHEFDHGQIAKQRKGKLELTAERQDAGHRIGHGLRRQRDHKVGRLYQLGTSGDRSNPRASRLGRTDESVCRR